MTRTPPHRLTVTDRTTGQPVGVTAHLDHDTKTVRLGLPDGAIATLDITQARAAYMILNEAIYCALGPDGPWLTLQCHQDANTAEIPRARR